MHLQGPVMGLGWVVSQAFSWTKLRVELAISFSALTRGKEVFLGVRLELDDKSSAKKKNYQKTHAQYLILSTRLQRIHRNNNIHRIRNIRP